MYAQECDARGGKGRGEEGPAGEGGKQKASAVLEGLELDQQKEEGQDVKK